MTILIALVALGSLTLILALMLVVVAIDAEQLPVAAVRGVVVVVVIAMVDGQFLQVFACEFARATPANPWVHFQGARTIALFALIALGVCPCNDSI